MRGLIERKHANKKPRFTRRESRNVSESKQVLGSPDPDLDTIADPRAREIVRRLIERKHANKKPRFTRRESRELRGVSESKQIRDEQAGKVLAYTGDGKVQVDPDSVFDAMIADAIASFAVPNQPRVRVREVPTDAGPGRKARKRKPEPLPYQARSRPESSKEDDDDNEPDTRKPASSATPIAARRAAEAQA
jgi:hypothetical protein